MGRDTVLADADDVEWGRMSIYDCEDMSAVLDELGACDFDADGYIINHRPYNNYYSVNNNSTSEKKQESDNTCLICCVLFVIIFLFYVWIT